ncbi:Xanthine/uracil/vitamin C permease [Cynara cardunculus var. scolymus]|uniref:Xanthine/uracil/vitamin C permease n=1 Tax=Cynara cardunculus var. scolymus TaxID=59895 RepID=A0A103XC88_CYNCS|nr:Xanthine/uracil/vitamin C permease [Cynara cardunculus var. scolymus]
MSNAGQGESRQPAAPKQELQPHPVTEQLAGVEYCVNSPPPWRFGTLMQTMFGTRLPSVVGGSHAFLIPIFSIIHAKRYNTFSEPHEYLPPYLTSKKPMFDRFAVLLSVSIAWTCTGILTWSGAYAKSTDTLNTCRTDRSGLIYGAPWIYVPYPFQWGTPTFDVGEVLMMMVASFISSIEGVGTFLGGMCGTVTGFAASTENCGALALTRVGSRRVIQISAAFMIFFSVFGKFGAVFASIPLPIAAALYCICFGCVCLGHLQFCNLNSFRTKFILGLSFSLGLSLPQFFREHWVGFDHGPVHTHARWFDNMVSVVLMSHASVAVMIAMVLDCTLCKGNDEYRKDWWEKFAVYGKDIRSDEFYKLPWQLNKLFPAL